MSYIICDLMIQNCKFGRYCSSITALINYWSVPFRKVYKYYCDISNIIDIILYLKGREILGLFTNDNRGFALSLDLLLAIIPLTIAMGFIAADMDNILYQTGDAVYRSSMDRAASDAVSTLMETSGTPSNWEVNGNPSVVGLAEFNTATNSPIEGTIDPVKLASLSNGEVQNLVGPNYNYYLNVSTINTTGIPITLKTLGNPSYGSATNLVRIQRDAMASEFDVISSLVGQVEYTGGSRSYTIPSFETNFNTVQSYDYWILIVNNHGFSSATVFVNGNAVNFNSSNITNASKISPGFLKDNSTTPSIYFNNTITLNATGTFPSSMDIYIIQAPQNITATNVNYNTVVPQSSELTFYLWSNS